MQFVYLADSWTDKLQNNASINVKSMINISHQTIPKTLNKFIQIL